MNCPNCGTPNAEGVNVCTNCGTAFNAEASANFAAQQNNQQPGFQPNYQQTQAQYAQAGFQQPYNQTPYPQEAYYGMPGQDQAILQPDGSVIYTMSEQDRMLRLINFILCVISCVAFAIFIIPLAWMIPMTVHSWGIYKGTKANSVAFAVCTLIFVDLIGGILLCVSKKEK